MEKVSIMEYLPQPQRIKLMNLIKKLGEETMEKEKYRKLYEKTLSDYEQLKQNYQKLEQKNLQLKAQISTSRLALSKAKQACLTSISNKKSRRSFQLLDQEQSTKQIKKMSYQFQNQQPEMKNQHKKQIDTSINQRSLLLPRPPKPQTNNTFRHSHEDLSLLNQTSNSKKQQIMNVRQQIKQLTNSMKKKQREGLKLSQKMKKGQQILRRFKKSQQKKNMNQQYTSEQQSDNDYSYQQPKKISQPILMTPQQHPQKKYKNMQQSTIRKQTKPKIKSQKYINQYQQQQLNQQKQDIHPNYIHEKHAKNSALKKQNLQRSSFMQRKNQTPDNFYDQSFIDLIKQLNEQ